jgi:hypothetical protein
MSEIDPRYTDKRTVERYMKQGLIDEKTFEKHVKGLPDVADKGEKLQSEADEYILDDDHPETDE